MTTRRALGLSSLGDASASDLLVGLTFRGHQTEVSHQLPGCLEAAQFSANCSSRRSDVMDGAPDAKFAHHQRGGVVTRRYSASLIPGGYFGGGGSSPSSSSQPDHNE